MVSCFYKLPNKLPLLPLKDVVVFPQMIIPVFISEEICIKAVEAALETHKMIFLSAFCEENSSTYGKETELTVSLAPPFDVYDVGTVAHIMRVRKLLDGRTKVLLQGLRRAKLTRLADLQDYPNVEIVEHDDLKHIAEDATGANALMNQVKFNLEKLVSNGRSIPPDILMLLEEVGEPGKFADLIISNFTIRIAEAQRILETIDPVERLVKVQACLERELENISQNRSKKLQVKEERNSGREQFLREQMRNIKMELGENDSDDDYAELRVKIEQTPMSPEAKEEVKKQLKRLERMNMESAEATMARTYIDLMLELPWNTYSDSKIELEKCKKVLDEDHYGLEKIKDRILEYLAVRKLNSATKGPILCFVGPPGVGKTSLGRSIARALDRKFSRISLGGMRDEAEIRGHRRTYVGAQPGRIIQAIKNTGTMNPVLMLDELDKLGSDYKGDPSSALLEVLDPEQNHIFSDHYLMVPFDLSQVIFVANANRLDTIPAPLRDRLEIIELSGYCADEKLEIAKNYIIPKALNQCGLQPTEVNFSTESIHTVINGYTRETGLRSLEKTIAAVCRKIARTFVENKEKNIENKLAKVTPRRVRELLGEESYLESKINTTCPKIGSAIGLAYTASGGDILELEVNLFPGKGSLILTGQLGDVMKESAQTALSYIKSKAKAYEIDSKCFSEYDIHIHAPAGAIPKDGPSAGVTITLALLSALKQKYLKQDIAMTGEISLFGKVLPVGGLREKLLAAIRYEIKTVCVPEINKGAIQEIPNNIRKNVQIKYIKSVEELIGHCFTESLLEKGGASALSDDKSSNWNTDAVAAKCFF